MAEREAEIRRGHEIMYGQPPRPGVVLDAVPDYDPSRIYVAPIMEFPHGRGSADDPGTLGEPELVGPSVTPIQGTVPWSAERIVAGLRRGGWATNNESLQTLLKQALKNKHSRIIKTPQL